MSLIRHPFARGTVLALLLHTALPVVAQDASRDPTVAPGDTGATAQSPAGVEGMTVLVRDERPYLVVGSRLYAPGDKVGNLRVERITEQEVWFHDGSALIKVPRFAGIARKTIVAKPQCSTPSAKAGSNLSAKTRANHTKTTKNRAKRTSPVAATSTPPAVAPCEDTQQ